MARTVVMIHPGGLGDLLLALPAIRSLRARFPGHELVLCGHGHASELLHQCSVVDHWLSIRGIACAGLFAGSTPDDSLLKNWLSCCDFAVAWSTDETGSLAASLKADGAATVLIHSPFCSTLKTAHQSDRFLETLHEPAADLSVASSLFLPDHHCEQGLAYLRESGVPDDRPLALIHPGSGSQHKCVKPNVLASVIERLREQGFRSLLLEGPADREIVANLLPHLPLKPVVLQDLSLCLLAGILLQVSLYIGHDSGVTHLSARLGVPTVALFGPTSSDRWAPRGFHVVVARGGPCHCPSWDDVSRCAEKPCLHLSLADILAASLTLRSKGVNPRICSLSALSPTSPYVRVTT